MTILFKAAAAPAASISDICDELVWEKYAIADGFLEGPNIDQHGTLWVVGITTGAVMRIRDGSYEIVGERSGLPNGARIAPDGRLIIADIGGSLFSVDLASGKRNEIPTLFEGKPLRGLNDLVFDGKGGIYFTEPYGSNATERTGRVFYAAPDDYSNISLFADNLAFPNGVAISADEQWVYVAESSLNQIVKIPARGAADPYAFSYLLGRMHGGLGPDGLAVDSEGWVYAAHYGAGLVQVFTPEGVDAGALRLPSEAGKRATNLAFHDGWLYVTEAVKNEIWRIRVKRQGLVLG